MVKRKVQLRNVSNIAASSTALLEIPCNARYHYIVLQHGYAAGTNTVAAAATNIKEIRIKVNGRVQRVISGTQLRDMNLLNGTAYDCTGLPNTAPGVSFPIYFAEPWREMDTDKDALAWLATGWNSFQIEVDLDAASTPTLLAWAVVDDSATGSSGIVKWLRAQIATGTGSQFDWSALDRRDWLQQISFYPATQSVGKVTFRKDGLVFAEMTAAANATLNGNYAMTPSASGRTSNIFDMVLDHDGLLGSALNMAGSKDVTFTIEAATSTFGATMVAIIQRLGPPE